MKVIKRITVIEDEPVISKLISHVLENVGFSVEIEHDGQNALVNIKKNSPDLVLLDLVLPSMSGLEILTKLRSDDRTKNIPIVVLTSRSHEDDKDKAFQLGATDYVTKPFSPANLVSILQLSLANKGTQN